MSTDVEEKTAPALSTTDDVKVDNELGLATTNNDGEIQTIHHRIDKAVERSYLRKLDFYLLPFLSLMYLFNSVDRVRSTTELGAVDCTDRVFSLICQTPKRTGSTRICISREMNTPFCCCCSMFRMALLVSEDSKLDRIADKEFDLKECRSTSESAHKAVLRENHTSLADAGLGLLIDDPNRVHELWRNARHPFAYRVRNQLRSCCQKNLLSIWILSAYRFFEAGFYAGTIFHLTLFYKRNELGFRIALIFGSAELAAAFSGILAYGVFQIKNTALKGWQYLFIIE